MKDRLVPIVPRLRDALRVCLESTRPGLKPKTLWHFVNSIIRRIVNRKVGVHTFRRSSATHIYENSSDLNLLKSLLGHSSINTTAIYATPTKQRERLAECLR